MNDYTGVVIFFVLSALLTGLLICLATVLGPKRKLAERQTPYECGKDPFELPFGRRTSVHFYLLAMIFIIFDVEIAFLFPWAVLFRQLGWAGFLEICFFVFFILLAYVYARKHKALEVH